MLLFIKKIHLDRILSGEKTCEIRVGKRYRNVRRGSTLSLNGKHRVEVCRVDAFDNYGDFDAALAKHHKKAGAESADAIRLAIKDCYGDGPQGPFFFFWLTPNG